MLLKLNLFYLFSLKTEEELKYLNGVSDFMFIHTSVDSSLNIKQLVVAVLAGLLYSLLI